jgi:hypothetical protein
MDQKLKKATLLGMVSTVTLMTVMPHHMCGREELCEIKSAELPHTHDRSPTPMQTSIKMMAESSGTASDTGVLTQNQSWVRAKR